MKTETTTAAPTVGQQGLIRLLEGYGFESQAGPLENCTEWQALRESATEYSLGDWVIFTLSGEIDGEKVETEKVACVAAMRLASSDKARYVEYGLTTDPTDVYHYGEPVKWWRRADLLTPNVEGDSRAERVESADLFGVPLVDLALAVECSGSDWVIEMKRGHLTATIDGTCYSVSGMKGGRDRVPALVSALTKMAAHPFRNSCDGQANQSRSESALRESP